MRRVFALVGALLLAVAVTASVAAASDQSKKVAAGWKCGADGGLPDGHCINPGTPGGATFVILVFDELGNRVATESATFQPSADGRPCPHDPESPDGTWWHPEGTPEGFFVCHHQNPEPA